VPSTVPTSAFISSIVAIFFSSEVVQSARNNITIEREVELS
jgi:hypothetical protein